MRAGLRVAAVSGVYVRPVRVKAESLSSLQISELLKREHESPFDTASFFTHCVKFLFFLILFTFWRPSLCSGCGKVSRNGEVIHHQQLPPPQHTHTITTPTPHPHPPCCPSKPGRTAGRQRVPLPVPQHSPLSKNLNRARFRAGIWWSGLLKQGATHRHRQTSVNLRGPLRPNRHVKHPFYDKCPKDTPHPLETQAWTHTGIGWFSRGWFLAHLWTCSVWSAVF